MKTIRLEIGSRIRDLRKERRWTQKRFAGLLGISQNYLSMLERGKGSFTAEQLLVILKHFNVPIDYFSFRSSPVESQIQNALARQGAGHLAEIGEMLPSEKLKQAADVIREALVSAEHSRQITAVAPILVNHAGQINFTRLRNEFKALGLENRLGWAMDCTLEAIKRENTMVLPREWRLKYRRATLIIEAFIGLWRIFPGPTPDPREQPRYDIIDPEINSEATLEEIKIMLSDVSKRWRIATQIEIDDFIMALRGARGAD